MNKAMAQPQAGELPRWVSLIQGVFSLIIGLLLLTNPTATTIVIVQFVGIYWLVSGVFSLLGIFMDRSMWGWKLVSGILGILAGLAVMNHPLWSTLMLPTILVIFMGVDGLIIGVIGLVSAFRGEGWGAAVLGVLSIIFGLLLLGSPMLTGLALPWVYGLFAVVGGIVAIVAALRRPKPAAM